MMQAFSEAMQHFEDDNPDVCAPVEAALAQLRMSIEQLEPKLNPAPQTDAAKLRAQFVTQALQALAGTIVQLHNVALSAGMGAYEHTMQQQAKARTPRRLARVGRQEVN